MTWEPQTVTVLLLKKLQPELMKSLRLLVLLIIVIPFLTACGAGTFKLTREQPTKQSAQITKTGAGCPIKKIYSPAEQEQLRYEIAALPPDSVLNKMAADYQSLRRQTDAFRGVAPSSK